MFCHVLCTKGLLLCIKRCENIAFQHFILYFIISSVAIMDEAVHSQEVKVISN